MRTWLLSVMLLAFAPSESAELIVRVTNRDGRPVSGLVVTVKGASTPSSGAAAAVVDQIDQRFVPFVLPVRVGTPVSFPNSDPIAHQVYSFSPAKRFELGLYRGRAHPPVVFDQPGVVVLGCNIHDRMIGYVYVTDASEFGKTDALGEWRSTHRAAGAHEVEVWSPLLARGEPALKRTIRFDTSTTNVVEFQLTRAMRPAPAAPRDPKIRDY